MGGVEEMGVQIQAYNELENRALVSILAWLSRFSLLLVLCAISAAESLSHGGGEPGKA